MKIYRFGLIGLGVMGQEMAALMTAHPRFHVTAGFDPARPAMGFPLLADAAAVVSHPDVDAIYTATPPKAHEAIVRLAVEAGKPILCEKPLAHSVISARACRDLAAGIPAAVNFSFAARDVAVRLAGLVTRGALGEINAVRLRARFAQWPRSWQAGAGRWLAEPAEGGFTREVVSHYVFLANRIFGPGKIGTAVATRNDQGVETSLQATITHGAIPFTIDAAIGGDRDDDIRFSITGSQGEAAIVDWSKLDYAGDAGAALPESAPLDALADLLDGKANQLATMDEACRVVEIIEDILATA